ncbi:hypothetical protein NPIL_690451 [Nephila pilipes]|uniref:Uncharacterized protein n=1 Tax=Nephila pilipes TaxID=299642 RepID=A0A8X6QWP4_NEPPI|nr:hypothetical protein NPIL_690451 [Nephila pilipes]
MPLRDPVASNERENKKKSNSNWKWLSSFTTTRLEFMGTFHNFSASFHRYFISEAFSLLDQWVFIAANIDERECFWILRLRSSHMWKRVPTESIKWMSNTVVWRYNDRSWPEKMRSKHKRVDVMKLNLTL